MTTQILNAQNPADPGYQDAIDATVATLRDGRLAVIPTDTVYGIAADAFTAPAVQALLRAKGRGRDVPVPVLIGDPGVLPGLVSVVPPAAQQLADAFWPGPLTIIVEYAATLAWDLGETDGTVALRMPDHPEAIAVLKAAGPLAVSSANRHGSPPARSAEEAATSLGAAIETVLDAGRAPGGVPSTIVDCTGAVPVVVRPGAIDLARLLTVVPEMTTRPGGAASAP